jgi:hypothetical protein
LLGPAVEILVRGALEDRDGSEAAQYLIQWGLATQGELATLSQEEIEARVRQRLGLPARLATTSRIFRGFDTKSMRQ